MASLLWNEDRYRVHFLCALCGGPFARVYRTNDARQPESGDARNQLGQGELEETQRSVSTSNRVDPLTETELTGDYPFRGAYDGHLLSEEDVRWTRVMRALIHRNAQVHPHGGREQLEQGRDVYLTGRGKVLEDASWATAHPSIEDDLEDSDDEGAAGPPLDEIYGRFHLYQEPDREDRKCQISSIPFHEECWDIFQEALRSARAARRFVDSPFDSGVSHETIWSYWCDLIPNAGGGGGGGLSNLSAEDLANGNVADPITRLSIGCMGCQGYREAQACTDGKAWLHVDGLHVGGSSRHLKILPSHVRYSGWSPTRN